MGDFINAEATINNKPLALYKRHIIAIGIGYSLMLSIKTNRRQ
jgi:hypothetical protein